MTLLITLLLCGADPEADVVRIGRLDHPPVREASGIVASRRHPGIFWVHNDSGNPPRLFAVRADGSLVREYAVQAPNTDWEDIAVDDAGHLYLGDIGNNDARLPLRVIYQLDEPDPLEQVGPNGPMPIRVRNASYYRFPGGGRFDAEALVVDRNQAILVAKSFDGRNARVYTVPLHPAAPLFRPAIPEAAGSLEGFVEPVTGADLSRNGLLVVCSTRRVGVYRRGTDGGWTHVATRRFRSNGDVEAVAWDGDSLILAGEGRDVFRVITSGWATRDKAPGQKAERRP